MIHCVSAYGNEDRHKRARKSWDRLDVKRAYISTDSLDRQVQGRPFMCDVIEAGWAMYPNEDVMLFTNSDAYLGTDLIEMLEDNKLLEDNVLIRLGRTNHSRPLIKPMTCAQLNERGEPFIGEDAMVFTIKWWEQSNWPDLIIGYQGWDYCARWKGRLLGVGTGHEMHGQGNWQADSETNICNLWNRQYTAEYIVGYENLNENYKWLKRNNIESWLKYDIDYLGLPGLVIR